MKTSARQIAKRYVRALFEVTSGAARNQVEKDLEALAAVYKESDIFRQVLESPLLSRGQQEQALAAVLKSIKAAQATQQFMNMLARQKRLPILPEIIDIFKREAAHARGEISAELISAAPLKGKDVNAISDRLSKAYGRKVVLETRENPALLGGVVVKVGSQQLDCSLSGKMRRLKNALRAA